MSRVGHNSEIPIRIHERYLQIILKFANSVRGNRIMDYGSWKIPARTDPYSNNSMFQIRQNTFKVTKMTKIFIDAQNIYSIQRANTLVFKNIISVTMTFMTWSSSVGWQQFVGPRT